MLKGLARLWEPETALIYSPPAIHPRAPRAMRRRNGRRRRVFAWLIVGALAVASTTIVAGWAYLASLPTVAGAQARVAMLLAAHQGVAEAAPAPRRIAEAVVAVEDRRFYLHHGIDTVGLLRAGWYELTTGSPHGGATITEQLAQALYLPSDHGLASHLEKAGLAIKLERRYTKAQILAMYLNAVYYGDGQWGIVQASETYFGVAPSDLTWAEASMLAGLPNAPSAYDPLHHFALARQRERLVLIALAHTGVLTQAEAAAIDARPPRLAANTPASGA